MRVTLGSHPAMDDALGRLQAVYEGLGVEVLRIPSPTTDAVFHRDVFAWTPRGLIKCRMGKTSRAEEPDWWFDEMGEVPILTIEEPATFEGADLLWVSAAEVIISIGERTNEEGFQVVRDFLYRCNIRVWETRLPSWHDQHLLGVANVAQGRVWSFAGTHLPKRFSKWRLDNKEYARKASNWVVAAGVVVMPEGCATTEKRLAAAGCEVVPVDISSLLTHGGGVACATGVLW